MFEKLKQLKDEYDDLTHKLADTSIMTDMSAYQSYAKKRSQIEPLVEKWMEYEGIEQEISSCNSLLGNEHDEELRKMALDEIEGLEERKGVLIKQIEDILMPDEDAQYKNRDFIMEIRAGTGGEESGLFAGDLFRMYSRYIQNMGWKMDVVDSNPTEIGGFKEIVFSVEGENAYNCLKFESGTHRVQRVPITETGGRVHTSAATVAILIEPEDVEIEVRQEDLRIDVYRSTGAGGQHVNTTDSAVRITHVPSGVVVTCQDERSQHKNKAKAMKVLRARLFAHAEEKQQSEFSNVRKLQVGTGDRSEKIRTYNYPQNRITDHRIGLSLYKLEIIMDGDLNEMVAALVQAAKEQRAEDNK
ncbi:peptide chain release factor 1 [bacterium]|nr:peptide chain release factor 1 [bacterium]MBU1752916.1 peptide chain release factor 1 [bacterium]